MSEKRKDSKGRVLKDGESQRANGTYDYRYTDIHKKRRCIYAKSLTELRKKEDELRRDMADGIDYAAGEMTAEALFPYRPPVFFSLQCMKRPCRRFRRRKCEKFTLPPFTFMLCSVKL